MHLKPEYERHLLSLPPIKCGDCTLCCQGDVITLGPMDDASSYETQARGAGLVLKRDEAGNCVYLGCSGCAIYDRQPFNCRSFDCRAYALFVAELSPDAQAFRERGRKGPVLAEGRRRLGV